MNPCDADFYRRLGERIRSTRKEINISQAELATLVGLSRAAIASIESGRQQVLVHLILKIASAFGKDPADLLKVQLKRQQDPTPANIAEELKDKLPSHTANKILKRLKNLGGI